VHVDVVVIGAGISGILSAKYLKEEGLAFIVLEQSESFGGLWNERSWVSDQTEAITSNCFTEISDFPLPEEFPTFLKKEHFVKYIALYVEHHKLRAFIRTGELIKSVSKQLDFTDNWIVYSTMRSYRCRSVIISTGLNYDPRPLPPMFDLFAGKCMHPSNFNEDSKDAIKGSNVLIYGNGETAFDAACRVKDEASKTVLCVPGGTYFTAKDLTEGTASLGRTLPDWFNPITDQHSSLAVTSLTLLTTPHMKPLLRGFYGMEAAMSMASKFGHSIDCWNPDYSFYYGSYVGKNAQVLPAIRQSQIIPKRDVAQVSGKTIALDDGSCHSFDVIVYSMGFRTFDKTPFVDVPKEELFLNTFCARDPSLAFVGFCRPKMGSSFAVSEIQARAVARTLSNRISLPSREDMLDDCKQVNVNAQRLHPRAKGRLIIELSEFAYRFRSLEKLSLSYSRMLCLHGWRFTCNFFFCPWHGALLRVEEKPEILPGVYQRYLSKRVWMTTALVYVLYFPVFLVISILRWREVGV